MKLLSEVLGGSYGGPSISYEEGKFILYHWGDAPVGTKILVSDETWSGFIVKVKAWWPAEKVRREKFLADRKAWKKRMKR